MDAVLHSVNSTLGLSWVVFFLCIECLPGLCQFEYVYDPGGLVIVLERDGVGWADYLEPVSICADAIIFLLYW